MNLENQNNNMQELDQRVEQLLTPRFAPSAEGFKLELKPRKARYAWLFSAMRICGVAAALIVGLFALIGPTNEVNAMSAEDIVYKALEEFQNADSFRVEFKAKVVANNGNDKTEIYRFAEDGDDVAGVLMLLKADGKASFRIEWSNGVVQLFDSFEMRYKMWKNGELVCDEPRTSINAKFMQLLSLESVKQEFESDSEIQIEEQGNKITLSHKADDLVEIAGIFSPDEGKLQEAGIRIKDASGKWVKVLSVKIDYSTPISKEVITAAPMK
jgi:hypothetical protein